MRRRKQKLIIGIDCLLRHLRRARRWLLWKELDGHCWYCGRGISFTETTLDHVVPKIRLGPDSYENLYPACSPCNRLKGGHDLKTFRGITIGQRRRFYYESGEPIDVIRARLWIGFVKAMEAEAKKLPILLGEEYLPGRAREVLLANGLIVVNSLS